MFVRQLYFESLTGYYKCIMANITMGPCTSKSESRGVSTVSQGSVDPLQTCLRHLNHVRQVYLVFFRFIYSFLLLYQDVSYILLV